MTASAHTRPFTFLSGHAPMPWQGDATLHGVPSRLGSDSFAWKAAMRVCVMSCDAPAAPGGRTAVKSPAAYST